LSPTKTGVFPCSLSAFLYLFFVAWSLGWYEVFLWTRLGILEKKNRIAHTWAEKKSRQETEAKVLFTRTISQHDFAIWCDFDMNQSPINNAPIAQYKSLLSYKSRLQ